ncbi:LuxR C-terminal-related transcriptional regulator [Burkholderia territorii]|uniref:LuxR C-terminal-related transcriptional regulator n=1 Tax=Burkholderia territorii TaxID=1503055 RepID=UPI0009BED21C|nr:response regulator transcription factor [Burkholderia territorii]
MDNETICDQTLPVLLVKFQPIVAHAMQIKLAMIDDRVRSTVCNCAESATKELRHSCGWFRIFIDLDVQGEQGMALVRQFCERGAANRCVAVTSVHRSFWLSEAKRLGMVGYIDKLAPIDDFTAALQSVFEGRPSFPDIQLRPDSLERLTNRQREVLSLLCIGYPTKVIASTLRLAEGTVDNHIGNILRTLNAHNRAHAIYKAVAQGYLPAVTRERASSECAQGGADVSVRRRWIS